MRTHRQKISHSLFLCLPALLLLSAGPANARTTMIQVDQRELLQELRALQSQVKTLQNQANKNDNKNRNDVRRGLDGLSSRLDRLERSMRDQRPMQSQLRPPSHVVVGTQGMNATSFSALRRTIGKMSFSSERLGVVATAARENRFDVGQIRILLGDLRHGEQIQALRLLWPTVIDRKNGFLLYDAFTFESDKREARKVIES